MVPTLNTDYCCDPYPDGSSLFIKNDFPVRYNPAIVITAIGFTNEDKNFIASVVIISSILKNKFTVGLLIKYHKRNRLVFEFIHVGPLLYV